MQFSLPAFPLYEGGVIVDRIPLKDLFSSADGILFFLPVIMSIKGKIFVTRFFSSTETGRIRMI